MVLTTITGDMVEKSLFNVDLKEMFQFQEIILEKERYDLLSGDHLMEPGTSTVLTTTIGDMEESSPSNADLKEISQYLLIILERIDPEWLYSDHLMDIGTLMEPMETGDLEVKKISNTDLLEIFQFLTSLKCILATFTREATPLMLTSTVKLLFHKLPFE